MTEGVVIERRNNATCERLLEWWRARRTHL